MNKRFWMAFAACYVVGQVIGFLVHGLWLQPTYESLASVFRPKAEMDANMWVMFLNSAVMLFVFCYIFTKGYEGKGVMEGVRYGALIGVLAGVVPSFDQAWIYPIPLSLGVTWAVAGFAYFVIVGAVLASIYRPTPK